MQNGIKGAKKSGWKMSENPVYVCFYDELRFSEI